MKGAIHMQRFGILLVAVALIGMSAAVATAQNPHFSQPDPVTCDTSLSGRTCTVCCSGTIVGVGSTPTSVNLDIADSGCTTRGNDTTPGGHVGATSDVLTPDRGGNITLSCSDLTVSLRCPGGLNTTLGPTGAISIIQNGNTTFVDNVDIEPCS
jgi:hypothetical protein